MCISLHKGRTESCCIKQWTYHESDVPHLLRTVLDISSVMCDLLQTQCEQPASDSLLGLTVVSFSTVCSQNTVHFLTTVHNSADFKLALIIQLVYLYDFTKLFFLGIFSRGCNEVNLVMYTFKYY